MTLRTTCPATPRAWTVELHPHASGLVLVCRHCPHGSTRITTAAARSAALAHLARHARGDLRPLHLRICQCHERGCVWHPRHRGCAGPIRLLLAREHGGRRWRLADACSACAAATAQAAVVPDTVLTRAPLQPETRRRHRRRPKGPGEQIRVREILSYLAAALPAGTSPAARLLALQCALRVNAEMHVRLPKGVLRSLRLDATPGLWHELDHARWLRPLPESTANKIVVALLDATLLGQAPARPDRMHAADWALRASAAGAIGPAPRLAYLYLAAHTDSEAGNGLCELGQMARACGISPAALSGTLGQLASTGLLKSWQVCPDSEDLHWILHLLS
ncbi:hypothetical protein ACFC08_29665 [Streptomyces sp. NPDC056112]|uniref:hypothetical protein n=1 Tax=Streptomyces sp. NPDC056112 TaxID=3345715 RepID=UPI0035D7C7B3